MDKVISESPLYKAFLTMERVKLGMTVGIWSDHQCAECLAGKNPGDKEGLLYIISTWGSGGRAAPFWYLNEILKNCNPASPINWDTVNLFVAGCLGVFNRYIKSDKTLFMQQYEYLYRELENQIKKEKIKDFAIQSMEVTPAKMGRKGAANSNARHDEPRELARKLAKEYWQKNQKATKQEVSENIEQLFIEQKIKNLDDHYSIGTIIDWIKDQMPSSRSKGGRPPTPKPI